MHLLPEVNPRSARGLASFEFWPLVQQTRLRRRRIRSTLGRVGSAYTCPFAAIVLVERTHYERVLARLEESLRQSRRLFFIGDQECEVSAVTNLGPMRGRH